MILTHEDEGGHTDGARYINVVLASYDAPSSRAGNLTSSQHPY